MKLFSAFSFYFSALSLCAVGSSDTNDYRLVWADEFDVEGRPNPENWTYEHGFVRNEELQWYQPDNAFVEDGLLVIEGRRERIQNSGYEEGSKRWKTNRKFAEYTSACLKTKGLHAWQYGRFEVKAKIRAEDGLWPAIWFLGEEGRWPNNGEIDLMEFYEESILANACWGSKGGGPKWDSSKLPVKELGGPDWDERFHVWRMDWDSESIKLYVDDRLLNTIDVTKTLNPPDRGIENPFKQPHFMLLNLAIGGQRGGDPSQTAFPSRYEVDYVRVYQKASEVEGVEAEGADRSLRKNRSLVVGGYKTAVFNSGPQAQTVNEVQLGNSDGDLGQGTLLLESGTLNVARHLVAGCTNPENDGFVEVRSGASLKVGGNAEFGRDFEESDGSLIVSGGEVQIAGDLAMGDFEKGGSMLRFHNPGASPPVRVGGKLTLGRCSLSLTFDDDYVHTPGTSVSLVSFGERDGQFLNFRQGDEFNCGPNRYRIQYSETDISLTALENWSTPGKRPNIILLFADDQGYADLSLQGDERYPMPRLQKLADEGVRFSDAYVTGGVCHPSRTGLLLGRYQQRFGTENNLSGRSHNGMTPAVGTVPRRLQGLGYRTYGIGKWHLGDSVEYHPNNRGFDRWYGMWSGSRSYWVSDDYQEAFQDQMTPDFKGEDGRYLTDRIGDKTVDLIEEHLRSRPADEPFFMYVSYTAVHGPVDIDSPPSPEQKDPRYERLKKEYGLEAKDYENSEILFSGVSQGKADKNRYYLAAMTLALDESIGKIVDKLEAEGLDKDTLIVYMSDNGGPGWSKRWSGNFSYNTPLRGYKGGSMRDGGIRVPGIASWPAVIPGGQLVDSPVSSLDFMATFVQAGESVPAEASAGLDGLNLLPLLVEGLPLPEERALFWRAGGVNRSGSAVRIGDWKLWFDDARDRFSLHNLREDIGERKDLSGEYPEIVERLRDRFTAWEAETLPPFYGTKEIVEDDGLERYGVEGGIRIRNTAAKPAWVSAPFRNPIQSDADFGLAFTTQLAEAGPYADGAGLWHAIGSGADRGQLIRFGIDAGRGLLTLSEGKSGQTVSVALPPLHDRVSEGTLSYNAARNSLTLQVGEAKVSLDLKSTYTDFSHYAFGVAGAEGELSPLY